MVSQSELVGKLKDILETIEAEFNGPGAEPRLSQFRSHMMTVEMVVNCLFEEAERMDGYRG
jgi:hypothetical protein